MLHSIKPITLVVAAFGGRPKGILLVQREVIGIIRIHIETTVLIFPIGVLGPSDAFDMSIAKEDIAILLVVALVALVAPGCLPRRIRAGFGHHIGWRRDIGLASDDC